MRRSRSNRSLVTAAPLFLAACAGGLTPLGGRLEDTAAPDIDVPDPDTDSDTVANAPPVADAGPDQTAAAGTVVQLDGSASMDPDEDILAYRWAFVDMPSESGATLINDIRVDPQFYADVPGTFEVELVVDDGHATDTDTVVITVEEPNEAPIADAGSDQRVSVGATVQLDGTASWDPEDDALTYTWTLSTTPTASLASLDNPSSAFPRFTADAAGQYVVTLTVSDGQFTSPPDTVAVFAEAPSDGDCGDCAAHVGRQVRQRAPGSRAVTFGLLFLPLAALFWQRRQD